MKKLVITSLCILLLVTMLTEVLFAAPDNQTNLSVYAEDYSSIMKEIKDSDNNLSKSLKEFDIFISEKTIMPIFEGSLIAYAETGDFGFAPCLIEGGQGYLAEVTDQSGNFAGMIEFSVEGKDPNIHMYMQTSKKEESVDFNVNYDRVVSLVKIHNMDVEKLSAKMMWVTGMGYVYYVTDGTKEAFIATHLKGANGDIFTQENNGIVTVDDQLTELGKKEIEKIKQIEAEVAALLAEDFPETGGNGTPAYVPKTSDNAISTQAPQEVQANDKPNYTWVVFLISITIVGLGVAVAVLLTIRHKKYRR